MDPVVLGLLSLVAIVIISVFGAPIGASIGLVSAFGLWMTSGWT